jgi:hypothetical protein
VENIPILQTKLCPPEKNETLMYTNIQDWEKDNPYWKSSAGGREVDEQEILFE